MSFYLYLVVSSLAIILLLIFNISFGLSIITGIPFAVSKKSRVRRIAEIVAELTKDRTNIKAVDIGSGDGRIVIALAQRGLKTDGLEINPFLVWWANWKIARAGLKQNAKTERANFWQKNFAEYDVVVLFGVFYIMEKMEKKLLAELRPGTIVVCNHFKFPNWQALKQEKDLFIYRR
jgi:2-polyprenyl-3-methyl-5-hydroxy-6-metoxy-1,4-benzoquinol methylase